MEEVKHAGTELFESSSERKQLGSDPMAFPVLQRLVLAD